MPSVIRDEDEYLTCPEGGTFGNSYMDFKKCEVDCEYSDECYLQCDAFNEKMINGENDDESESEFLPEPSDEVMHKSAVFSDFIFSKMRWDVVNRNDVELCSVAFGLFVESIKCISSFGWSKKEMIREIDTHFCGISDDREAIQ